jgi:hypothetical protein
MRPTRKRFADSLTRERFWFVTFFLAVLPLAGVGFLTVFFLPVRFFAVWERISSRPRPGGRKRIKPVTVKGLSPMQNIWILHSRHIGRLAPAVRCVREAVKQQLRTH